MMPHRQPPPSVTLPRSRTTTSRLGLGLATVMREPSRRARRRLVDEAMELGIRHFDVAPSYGLGEAESLLGECAAGRRERVTIATKLGLVPTGRASLLRLAQRPLRHLVRALPSLQRSLHTRSPHLAAPARAFSVAGATRSLDASRRALRTDHIDILLLHDVHPSELTGELLEWLTARREDRTIGQFGLATSLEDTRSILVEEGASFDVVQVASSVFTPAGLALAAPAVPLRISHGVLSGSLPDVDRRLAEDAPLRATLSERVGVDLTRPHMLASGLVAWGLDENPDGIVLIGTSRPPHLRAAVAATQTFSPAAAAALADGLRELGTRGR